MCEFISWIERDGAVVYLTAKDLKTSRGKKLRDRIGADINGHGAIREYWDIAPGTGIEKECTNFSTPSNFPPQIVAAIKAGEFRGVGIAVGLLSPSARKQYDAVSGSAWKQYDAVRVPARRQYDAVRGSAFWGAFADNANRADAWKD